VILKNAISDLVEEMQATFDSKESALAFLCVLFKLLRAWKWLRDSEVRNLQSIMMLFLTGNPDVLCKLARFMGGPISSEGKTQVADAENSESSQSQRTDRNASSESDGERDPSSGADLLAEDARAFLNRFKSLKEVSLLEIMLLRQSIGVECLGTYPQQNVDIVEEQTDQTQEAQKCENAISRFRESTIMAFHSSESLHGWLGCLNQFLQAMHEVEMEHRSAVLSFVTVLLVHEKGIFMLVINKEVPFSTKTHALTVMSSFLEVASSEEWKYVETKESQEDSDTDRGVDNMPFYCDWNFLAPVGEMMRHICESIESPLHRVVLSSFPDFVLREELSSCLFELEDRGIRFLRYFVAALPESLLQEEIRQEGEMILPTLLQLLYRHTVALHERVSHFGTGSSVVENLSTIPQLRPVIVSPTFVHRGVESKEADFLFICVVYRFLVPSDSTYYKVF